MTQLRHIFLVLILCFGTHLYALSLKITHATDAFFSQGSSAISLIDDKFEEFACRALQTNIEVIIAIGHADKSENNAQKLSEVRAQKIKEKLVSLGLASGRIFTEGKAASQPVSSSSYLNRRVEVELVATARQGTPIPCPKSWIKIIEDMPLATALIVVRGQVEAGMPPSWPAVAAIRANRMDMLMAVLTSAIRPNVQGEDGSVITRAALQNGDVRYIKYLISQGFKASEVSVFGQPIAWVVCSYQRPAISELQQTELVHVLWRWGARPVIDSTRDGTTSPLGCAASTNRVLLVKQLLAAGADPNAPLTSPPILDGARYREVVQLLLNAGANPAPRCNNCLTLFHYFKFENAQDVAWIAKLPVDINFSIEDGYTPLHMALQYAAPDVLDAFVKHGATLDRSDKKLINSAFSNAALAWLLDKNVSPEGVSELPHRIVRRSVDAHLALAALHRRGFNLNQVDKDGKTASHLAIQILAADLLEQLIQFGVIDLASRGSALLDIAQRVNLRQHPIPCLHCMREPGWYELESKRLNAPEVIADRLQRKDKIIQMLQSAIAVAESKR